MPDSLTNLKLDEVPFKKIVIALDGSSLAEQVIAMARSFARRYDAEIEIVCVENKIVKENIHLTDAQRADIKTELQEYIRLVSELIEEDGLKVKTHFRVGEPANEIDAVARETNADLIIMTTRGKFEIGQLITKSITQRVIQKTSTPTLLIRPTDNWRSRRSEFKNILVASRWL